MNGKARLLSKTPKTTGICWRCSRERRITRSRGPPDFKASHEVITEDGGVHNDDNCEGVCVTVVRCLRGMGLACKS